MNKILVIAEQSEGRLSPAVAKTLACARQIEHESLDVVVFAADVAPASAAARLEGVSQVFWIELSADKLSLAAVLTPYLSALVLGYSHILASGTSFGRDFLPRLAAKLDTPQISEIVEVENARTFKRHIYAGNALISVHVPEGMVIATVRANAFKPVEETTTSVLVQKLELDVKIPLHTRFVSLSSNFSERPDLQSAAKVIAGGRGVGTSEGFSAIFALADRLGAAVGASRAAVDAGFVSNDLQIGQTSKIIAPDLYIAFGISGAFQHIAGIKDAGIIVAVNTDPNAPIFEIADFGLVGDLFEVIPQLEQALNKT